MKRKNQTPLSLYTPAIPSYKHDRALSPEPVQNESLLPPRPSWARVPPLLCLFLEDMVTLACAASTASTDDSELLELQEAGVMMLTEVARTFAQVRK